METDIEKGRLRDHAPVFPGFLHHGLPCPSRKLPPTKSKHRGLMS